MKRIHTHMLIILQSVAVVTILSLYTATPVFFTTINITDFKSHYNPRVFEITRGSSGGELVCLMAELLNSTCHVLLIVRAGDITTAEKEFSKIMERSQCFDSVVINFKVTMSDVEKFVEQNQEYIVSFEEFLQRSFQYEDLKTLEIRQPSPENHGQFEFWVRYVRIKRKVAPS